MGNIISREYEKISRKWGFHFNDVLTDILWNLIYIIRDKIIYIYTCTYKGIIYIILGSNSPWHDLIDVTHGFWQIKPKKRDVWLEYV